MKSTFYVTADDFGLHMSINEGILALHDTGIVNRTSIIVGTEYFEESVDALKKRPKLAVGVHLNLTDGKPILPTSRVSSLVNDKGDFIGGRHIAVALSVMLGAYDVDQIRAEWSSQIEKAIDAGLKITFLNSHGHIHLLPQLQDVTLDIAHKYKIGYIRTIFNCAGIKGLIYRILSRQIVQKIQDRKLNIDYPVAVYGIDNQGHLTNEIIESELKKYRKGEIAELITHPAIGENAYHKAWKYETAEEFGALVDRFGKK